MKKNSSLCPLSVREFINKEAVGCINEEVIGAINEATIVAIIA